MKPLARSNRRRIAYSSLWLWLSALAWLTLLPDARCEHWCYGCTAENSDVFHYWICPDPGLDWFCEESEDCNCSNPSGTPDGWWSGTCPGCGGSSGAGDDGRVVIVGMPQWSVSEPVLNLWLRDTPVTYQPTRGGQIAFELFFKNELGYASGEGSEFTATTFAHAGRGWFTPWCSYVSDMSASPTQYRLSNGRGSWLSITNDADPTFRGQMTSTLTAEGFPEISYPSGAVDTFGQSDGYSRHFRTSRRDRYGNITRFQYDASSGVLCLTNVVDADGRVTTLTYTNLGSFRLLATVTDPFGRTARLTYDASLAGCPLLTNITDAVGLSSSFEYDAKNNLSRMTTPYGTTGFTGLLDDNPLTGTPTAKALQVRETGAHQGVRDHLYLYVDSGDANKMPTAYSDWRPSTTNTTIFSFANTFDATNSSRLNTFYWNPVQYGRLPSGFVQGLTNGALAVSNLTSGNYLEARQRHWLLRTNDVSGPASVSHALSLERAPSPDGTTQGQITWYDYDNKYREEPGNEGSSILPRFIAWKLPNGQSRFTKYVRNSLGHPAQLIETWEESGGTVRARTNTFTYAANGIYLLSVSNTLGSLVSSNIYNANGLVTTNYNALLEATRFTYDSSNHLTSTRTPAGLTTTNVYGADGFLSRTIDLEIARTNSYTWSKALVYSHTDERGLTITNTWDNLNRLIKVTYPDGTFVTNVYVNLDRVMAIDRMGFTNRWEYNDFRQVTRQIDALNRTNTFQYCECGSPEFAWDALNSRTDFYYDLAGRRVATAYADSYWVSNRFDLMGQVTNVLDSAGSSATNWYNHQGLLVSVSNALGRVSARLYDSLDRATNSVDANGVTLTLAYDVLGRVLTRTYPDNGVERFGYGAAGLLAYTNQVTNVTFYGYDPARRKTAETNANQEVTRFYYDASGNLTNLLDGKSQNTTWKYDLYGRVTNKLDHLGTSVLVYAYDLDNRLTNRTSAAKGGTAYRFDAVGNLTNVDYTVSPDLALRYDGLNRLTNLVTTGTFTNRFGYTAAGLLAFEDGPWDSDSVSFGYANRLRTSLTVESPTSAGWGEAYGYDAAKRLTNVASLAGSFGYDYTGGSQVGKLTLPGGAYITNTFDNVGRLLSTSLKNSQGTLLNGHSYGYDAANQRTQQVFTAGNYVNYTYDPIGQLKTASGKESGGTTNRLHEKFGYVYDAAGNLSYRTNNALVQTFGVNSLNELTTVSRSGTLTVAGTTTSAATNVTVNAQAATLYGDATFAREGFSLADGNNTFTAIAKDSYGRQDTNVVTAWLPASASYVYDLNGNLLSDGKRGFDYDDENQLIRVTVTNAWKSEFGYDGLMRRRVRKEYTWSGGAWVQANEVRYVYDRKLVLQERDANNIGKVVYTRGRDLSGSLEEAGGIGGLLARTDQSTFDPQLSTALYQSDANGNVVCLINSSNAVVARYQYDPYGNILSLSGPLAEANLYRFSSKEAHPNSGLVYYLYRYYEPGLQRWINRDPIVERGFLKLLRGAIRGTLSLAPPYSFVRNAPVASIDALGLTIWRCTRRTSGPPFGGFGRHSYLWDDRSPIAPGSHSCGLESGYGSGGTSGPTDVGPVGLPPSGGMRAPYENPFDEAECYPVQGSEGHENEIMEYCREHVNNQPNVPGIWDCHYATKRVLQNLLYPVPPTRRLNDNDLKMPPDYTFPQNPIFW